jgi:hypothetical protein
MSDRRAGLRFSDTHNRAHEPPARIQSGKNSTRHRFGSQPSPFA